MMESGLLSIYLNRLKNATKEVVRGKECIVIPITDNDIFISDKGTAVLTVTLLKMKEIKWGKTHALQPRIRKDERDKMSAEEKKNIKDLGFFKPFEDKGEKSTYGGSAPSSPRNEARVETPTREEAKTVSNDPLDDLPF